MRHPPLEIDPTDWSRRRTGWAMIAILAVVFLAAAAVAVKGWADSNAALDRANATLDRIEAQSNEIGEQISSDCAAPSEPG